METLLDSKLRQQLDRLLVGNYTENRWAKNHRHKYLSENR